MSLAGQMRGLQSQVAAFRNDMFGAQADGAQVTADYNAGEFPELPGYYSPIKTREQTDQAGFFELHDCMFRVIKSKAPGFVPEIDKQLLIKEGENEIVLRIDEIGGIHPLSAEWILGCKAVN